VTPTGTGPLRAGEGRAVLAGGGDRARILCVDRARGQKEPRDQGEGQQEVSHQTRSL
jgi:hypothetical protein